MKELFTKQKYEQLREYISNAKQAVIITHTNPDGDAVGSSLALQKILAIMNLKSKIVISNNFPNFLAWMNGSDKILIYNEDKSPARMAIKDADLVFCLDFNQLSRVDILENIIRENEKAPRVIIDHHVSPANDFNLSFSYSPISSTSELVYRIGKKMLGTKHFTTEIAECIYCGMMTDSGGFAHSSSYPDFFKIIAALLECGIDKDKIKHLVFDNFSASRMQLLGYALQKMVVLPQLHTAYIILSQEELKKFSFITGDTEGFVNYPLSISGISLSLFFTEKDDFMKLSLRSTGNFDVNEMSRQFFHGGGHKNAAGGKMFCKVDQCEEQLISVLKSYEKKLQNI